MVYARSIALVLSVLGAVSALPSISIAPSSDMDFADLVTRKVAPKGWETWGFEDYNVYHTRYNALGCKYKHDTTFFKQCCGPLRTGKTLSSRPAQCDPANSSTASASSALPTVSSVVNNAEVDDDDDECEDDDEEVDDGDDDTGDVATSTSARAAASTSATSTRTSTRPSSTSSAAQASSTGTLFTGGYATFYYQNGNAGACGKKNPDSALIGAIDHERWGKSSFGIKSDLCGKQVEITNPANGKSVVITIADVCPSCKNKNSIDLSEGAFTKIATKSQGMVKIEWKFL